MSRCNLCLEADAPCHAPTPGPAPLRMGPQVAQWMDFYAHAGAVHDVCPYLLAAVCHRESRGGLFLRPRGPGGTGDGGHGHGLMQVDGRYHAAWLQRTDARGTPLWKDPHANILKGAEILAWNLRTCRGDWPAAVAAYNASVERVLKAQRRLAGASPELRLRGYDDLTTGKNYASDVLGLWAGFRAAAEPSAPALELSAPHPGPALVRPFTPLYPPPRSKP